MNATMLKRVFYVYAACLFPTGGHAQEDSFLLDETPSQESTPAYSNEVELGIGYNSEDSFKFGEYSGLEESGFFAIGNIRIRQLSAYDDDSTEYWELTGSNLGLDSRSLYAEYGQQGKFSAFIDYDQLPHFRFDDAKTPFLGAGSSDQALTGGWVASDTTAGMTNLLSSLKTFTIETERQKYGGGFSWLFADNWEMNGQYHHETKEGRDTLAAIFGTNGGNPRGAILIQPVDYETDHYELSLAYSGSAFQVALGYHLSQFSNDDQSLAWDNPFLRPSGGNTWSNCTALAPCERGRMALPPDNQAQQLTFSGGYNLGYSTRLTANISYGKMEQNEAFLPYTINPNLAVPASLPRTDLDGEVDTLYVKLGFSARPLRKLDVRANYIYDDQDNETPRDIYQLVLNDVANQGAIVSANARINTPYSFEKHRFQIDAGYRLFSATKLTAGYEYEQINRDFSEVDTTDEHTGKIKLWSSLSDTVSGWFEYAHAEREGSAYISNQPFLDGHNPDYIATLAPNNRFINDPLLRKFSYTDRDRDKFSATVNFVPVDPLSFSITGYYAKNDYDESELGLQESEDFSITVDAAYTPVEQLTTYAFFTWEDFEYEQRGYQRSAVTLFPGFIRDPAPCATCGFWNVEIDDDVYTAGAGLDWAIIEDKLNLKADYTYSRSITDITPQGDANLTFANLPGLTSRLHSFNLTGEYQVMDNLALRLRYLYERLKIKDFALDGVEPDTLANVITTGNSSPDYAGHVLGLSFVYSF